MKEAIDVYIKIIIAFISFIAPSFTILISLFLEGIEKKKTAHFERLENLKQILKVSFNESSDIISTHRHVNKVKNQYDKEVKKIKHEINLLTPKRQIRRVFASILLSLVFVSFYYIARTDFYHTNKFWIKFVSLITSLTFFIYSAYAIWQLFCVILDTKRMLLESKSSIVLEPEKRSNND